MSQIGKKSAGTKSNANYLNSIIGVTIVLFLFGIVGWFMINLRKTGDYFKEKIQVNAYLNPNAKKPQIDSLTEYINSLPYANRVEYVDKNKAAERWNKEYDSTWKQFIENNPLPESIDFNVKADHVDKDSLNLLAADLQDKYPGLISEFKFPAETVVQVSNYVKTGAIIFLVVAILLLIFVIFSIDNTIKLSMYSNRFLIKTMQMVGATRKFIAGPITKRAVINGLIASLIAIAAIYGTIILVEKLVPDFKVLHDNISLIILFGVIILLGILITVGSTYRAVIKYLKLRLDDLY